MIAVFVSQQNGVDRREILTYRRESLPEFPAAEARINQEPGSARRDEGRIPSTAARKNADLDDEVFRLSDRAARFANRTSNCSYRL